MKKNNNFGDLKAKRGQQTGHEKERTKKKKDATRNTCASNNPTGGKREVSNGESRKMEDRRPLPKFYRPK